MLEAVAKWGPNDWYQIASAMPGRLPRQCRERYKNHARSGINTAPFTRDEDKIIVTAQAWCDVVLCVMFFAACVRTLTIGILSACCLSLSALCPHYRAICQLGKQVAGNFEAASWANRQRSQESLVLPPESPAGDGTGTHQDEDSWQAPTGRFAFRQVRDSFTADSCAVVFQDLEGRS